MLAKVISGGQTGVDQAALRAAKACGLQTGGYAPKGYRTDDGPNGRLLRFYGLREHPSPYYPPRTHQNVIDSDATLILGNPTSAGCTLTARYAREANRPCYCLRWVKGSIEFFEAPSIKAWLQQAKPTILNVAGNRESTNPGIGKWSGDLLMHIFSKGI
jgi:Circularly permutated YpsA SLOG family